MVSPITPWTATGPDAGIAAWEQGTRFGAASQEAGDRLRFAYEQLAINERLANQRTRQQMDVAQAGLALRDRQLLQNANHQNTMAATAQDRVAELRRKNLLDEFPVPVEPVWKPANTDTGAPGHLFNPKSGAFSVSNDTGKYINANGIIYDVSSGGAKALTSAPVKTNPVDVAKARAFLAEAKAIRERMNAPGYVLNPEDNAALYVINEGIERLRTPAGPSLLQTNSLPTAATGSPAAPTPSAPAGKPVQYVFDENGNLVKAK